MKTIKLYGHLGKQFGKIHKYHVETPAEAIRLLSANYKGFAEAVLTFNGAGYRVVTGTEDIGAEDLSTNTGKDVIKFIPVISGEGGLGRIIVGAALMYFSAGIAGSLVTGLWGAGMTSGLAYGAIYTAVSGMLSSFGMSLILGGVSQLLYKAPPVSVAAKQAVSGSFDGAVNTTRQGVPIAVGYGELIIGSAVISAGISTVAVPV